MREDFEYKMLRFKDKHGNPCCAEDFTKADGICEFYMTSSMGTKESCYFLGCDGARLRRRDSEQGKGMGTLIPHKNCPIWPELIAS